MSMIKMKMIISPARKVKMKESFSEQPARGETEEPTKQEDSEDPDKPFNNL